MLHAACKALKHLCWDRALLNTARQLGGQYGECIYDGYWHTDLRRALEAFFESASSSLCGTVKLKLGSGSLRVASRQSPYSLYESNTVTFEADDIGIHKLADGYCKITSLKQRQMGLRDQRIARQQKEAGE